MTRRNTASVPDDASQLDAVHEPQASTNVTAAPRARHSSGDLRLALKMAGHREFPYDPVGAASRLAAERVTPAERDTAIATLAGRLGLPVDDLRTNLDSAGNR